MGSLRQTVSGDSHTSRTSSGISKMRHFTINLVVNIIGAILFLIMGIALIIGFALNQSIVEELQQAANFDNWNPFILCAGILALFTAGVFILGSWKVEMRNLNPSDYEVGGRSFTKEFSLIGE